MTSDDVRRVAAILALTRRDGTTCIADLVEVAKAQQTEAADSERERERERLEEMERLQLEWERELESEEL